MRNLRSMYKVAGILIFTLISYGLFLLVYLPVKLSRRDIVVLQNFYMKWWAKGTAAILNIKVHTEGTPPAPPFFLVSNHLSYIDIIPLYLNVKTTFVAKKEVRSWPLLGFMVMTMGVVFIDRTVRRDVTRVNQIISDSLNDQQGMILFPEGTTSGGHSVLPFRPPLLHFPAEANIPVHYAAIRYETDQKSGDLAAEQSVCFYGKREPFYKHVWKLAGNRRVDCTIRFCDRPIQNKERKNLAGELQKGVSSLFEPMS
jgi:lyso-ornithine lipid O-acyltransferase